VYPAWTFSSTPGEEGHFGWEVEVGSLSIFVDAGYLFKQGSGAVLKAKLGRHEIALDAQKFIDALGAWVCEQYPKDELLRTYWYDGARQGVPTPDQLHVAALPFVKLRLGRINSSGQQKGVDTLIVRDLMVLSQERSIQRAIVLSGDEDLREGIDYAQDRGVRVAVVGIDANGDRSQSVELVREADESLVLPSTILDSILTRKELPPRGAEFRTTPPSSIATPGSADVAGFVTCAKEFARQWLEKATPSEVAAIVTNRPRIPRDLDALILQHAVHATGVFTIADEPRRAMRAAFWAEINQVATPTTGQASGEAASGAADKESSS
jgi:hypothetical protein